MRWYSFLLALLAGSAALALITIINVTGWIVKGNQSPLVKLGNSSLAPLSYSWWFNNQGLNVTNYKILFIPGWEEIYEVGSLQGRAAGLQAYLQREAVSGTATYTISLDGYVQISNAQSSGAWVSLPAPIVWRSVANTSFYVLTTARSNFSGAKLQQYINFSASPMSLLSSASYSCTTSTSSDSFAGACTPVQYSFSLSVPNNRTYVSGKGTVYRDPYNGNPAPSLYTESSGGYTAFFIDYSPSPFSASTSFSFQYFFKASLQDTDYIQVNFFVDTNADGKPDLEVIYYGSGRGTSPYSLAPVVYGYQLPTVSRLMPGFQNVANRWVTITISQVYPTGYVVGLAFTAASSTGVVKAWWDNVDFARCAAPSYLGAYTRGGQYTAVYVDDVSSPSTPPSVATEVDAYGAAGNPATDYGVSAAIYDVSGWGASASNFTFSIAGMYVRNATDIRNNVAYVSVGVDTDGDGLVDVEYIFYRYDTGDGPGVIVSVLARPGAVVCTVDSTGACTPVNASFVVYNLGAMASGSTYTWKGSLPLDASGVVRSVAFAVTDASYNAPGTQDDVWVWWDDFSATYRTCTPLPPGWSVSGSTYYRSLVPGAIAYAGSFSGDGGFYLFDAGLSPLVGARRSGSSWYARCGASEALLGASTSVYWVDLRPLQGLWDVILRDGSGAILFRYGCAPSGTPQYVGFINATSFEFRAWGG